MIDTDKLNELAIRASNNSLKHGFNMMNNQWWMTVAACEVAEVVEAYRNNRKAPSALIETLKRMASVYRSEAKDTIQDEMADIAIYCLSIAGCSKVKFSSTTARIPLSTDLYRFDDTACSVMKMLIAGRFAEKDDLSKRLLDIIDVVENWMEEETGDDLIDWIEAKMNFNKYRPYLHGRYNDIISKL